MRSMTDADATPAPHANPHLVGHETAEALLAHTFDDGHLAHAWMIGGPRGVGKATLAYRFARYVLAGGARALGPDAGGLHVDPAHPVFRRVAANGHADLLTLRRSADPRRKTGRIRAQIVVDDARRLGDFLALSPAEGGWRVAVVDAADEMNRNAANAVLKIVEEPPERALLLLVAHVPGRVPATLRSRCRRLSLAPLPARKVAEFLARARPDLDDGERDLLAALSDGAPGAALGLADGGGIEIYGEMIGLIVTAPGMDARALHAFADKLARRGAESAFSAAMGLLAGWIGRLVAAGARGAIPDGAAGAEAAASQRLLAASSLDRWAALWEKTNDLASRTDRVNLDRKQVVLSLFLSLDAAAHG